MSEYSTRVTAAWWCAVVAATAAACGGGSLRNARVASSARAAHATPPPPPQDAPPRQAVATTSVQRPPWAAYEGPGRAEREAFTAAARARMDRTASEVRAGIAAGRVAPSAAAELDRERGYVERLLARYAIDGALSADEREHVRTAVAQMRALGSPDRAAVPTAVGGGPVALSARR